MAKFLIGTIPVVGHVNPALPIARELVNRGHEVCWYTGGAFQAKIESTGARFAPIVCGLDYSYPGNVSQAWTDQRNALRGLAQLKFDLKHFFVDAAVGQVKDLTAILRDFPADVILADFCFLGAAWVHEQGGPPWAGFGISVLAFSSRDTAPFGLGLKPDAYPFGFRNRALNWLAQQVLFRVTTYTSQVRADLGLLPCTTSFFDTLSPFSLFSRNCPRVPEYPRRDLPTQVHFVGPLLSSIATEFAPPMWWDDLKGSQPVVLVTQGTVATDPEALIVPTLRALAQEDVLVVATTSGKSFESMPLNAIPANARIESFIPYSELLSNVDVMITNGGYNGVQMALAQGVPLVAAGQSEDKPEIGARIEWTGVGINLKTGQTNSAADSISQRELLTDHRYKSRARDFQTAIRQYDAPTLAATRLEQLATTKQPVFRSE